MKNNDRTFQPGRWLALFLSLLLSTALLFPGAALAAEAEDGVFHIQTQVDLEELAELCRLDTWSQGKTVVLDNDLALDEDAESFLPIPTFRGTFQGEGHTISGLSLDGETSNAGLFDTLQADAVVNDLTVETPSAASPAAITAHLSTAPSRGPFRAACRWAAWWASMRPQAR